jgi:hypothetical protein
MGFAVRKSGPEQTRRLPEFTLIITIIYILFNDGRYRSRINASKHSCSDEGRGEQFRRRYYYFRTSPTFGSRWVSLPFTTILLRLICVFVCDYRSRISCVFCMDVCACLIGHVFRVCCMSRVLPEPSRTGWSIRPWRTGLGQASRTGGSL